MATPNYNLPTISGNLSADVVRDMNALAGATDGAIKTVDDKVTQHLADYEYQTPTISGTQIRLKKQSNTNRLLFKLDAELVGNITVSLDNGATSKNLVDVDGVQVTSLEKGFAEIVAVGNFFILRNRGLSKSDLQALITIVNEAEANESVLRTQYVNAVNGADETINLPPGATWNDILLQIPNIKTGSRVKVGTVGREVNTRQFVRGDNSFVNREYVVISDVDFVPSYVVVYGLASATHGIMTLYSATDIFPSYQVKIVTSPMSYVDTSGATYSGYKKAGAAVLEVGNIVLPVTSAANSYTYIAIE